MGIQFCLLCCGIQLIYNFILNNKIFSETFKNDHWKFDFQNCVGIKVFLNMKPCILFDNYETSGELQSKKTNAKLIVFFRM